MDDIVEKQLETAEAMDSLNQKIDATNKSLAAVLEEIDGLKKAKTHATEQADNEINLIAELEVQLEEEKRGRDDAEEKLIEEQLLQEERLAAGGEVEPEPEPDDDDEPEPVAVKVSPIKVDEGVKAETDFRNKLKKSPRGAIEEAPTPSKDAKVIPGEKVSQPDQVDFRSLLKKKTPAPAPAAVAEKKSGVEQVDFRNLLKKRQPDS